MNRELQKHLPRSPRSTLTAITVAALLLAAPAGMAAPHVVSTEVIGPFTGVQAPLHPDNLSPHRIEYWGTDLGWTYEHQGELKILFGDTAADADNTPIEASTGRTFEDSYGSIDLRKWNRPETFSREHMPRIKLGQNPDSTEMAAIDPGHAMEGFKTPVGGFSNGEDEYGVFFTYKPQGCRTDADCSAGATCDVGLGYLGPPYTDDEGITWACVEGTVPMCVAATMSDAEGNPVPESGFCNDRTSTIWADTPMGRTTALTVKLLIGKRDREVPKRYHTGFTWHTNKFMNPAFRTVHAFEPPGSAPPGFEPDFEPADDPGPHSKVFVWGRPHFVGVNATGRYLGQYFAYVDLPKGESIDWSPQYFAGLDDAGNPIFSASERDAVPLDMNSFEAGMQPQTRYDIIDQVSIAWVPQLSAWLMFYGGGMINRPLPPLLVNCGVLEVFAGSECTQVEIGNGALRMRSASHPWGPWTPPKDLVAPGDPALPEGQYGPGGMLRHPQCTDPACAPHTGDEESRPVEYGFFYGANIIEQWTRPAGKGVDIIWNASTWDPYRVILLRSRIVP